MAKRRAAADLGSVASWLAENPLRKWRGAQKPEGWRQAVLARQIKASHTAVRLWEEGKRLPKIDAFAKLEALTKITCQEWMDWYKRRPKPKKKGEAR